MATGRAKGNGTGRGQTRLPSLLLAFALLAAALPAWAQDEAPRIDGTDTVTISTRNMDLAAFLELLSVRYKLNIVSPKDIAGKVSVNFYDVPPLDALSAVLQANGYQYVLEKTAGRPILKIAAIVKTEGEVPVVVRSYPLNYSDAAEVAKVIETLLTKNGGITVAKSKNTILVKDTAESLQRVDAIVQELDEAPRQVVIDAKMVELSHSDTEETGIDWSMFQKLTIADISADVSFARAASWTTTRESGAGTTHTRDIVTTSGHNIDLRAGILNEGGVHLVLDFFDSLTNSTIVSRPSVRTVDNKPAHIISGQIVPIPLFDFAKDTGVRTLSGFQDQEIGIELTVTPHINKDGYILLEINPRVESIDRFITVGGDQQRPVTNTRQATTTIRIKDGDTAVIGGLTSSTETLTTTGLPWIKDVPYLGALFRNQVKSTVQNELIIFITPKVVESGNERLSEAEKRLLKKVGEASLLRLYEPAPEPAGQEPPGPAAPPAKLPAPEAPPITDQPTPGAPARK